MSKIRVYELAKELDISSKKLISMLQEEFNVQVKNHMSVIESEDAELIKELLTDKEKDSEELTEDNEKTPSNNKEDQDVITKYEEIYSNQKSFVKNKKKNRQSKGSHIAADGDEKNKINNNEENTIEIPATISVKEFAERINKPSNEVIKQLIFWGNGCNKSRNRFRNCRKSG